jgi:hypothetical protein
MGKSIMIGARTELAVIVLAIVIIGLPIPLHPSSANAAHPEIGSTVAVKNRVTAELADEKRRLLKGAKVHQDEILVTGAKSSAEIKLLDDTKLAVGPSARLVLDKFVYDADAPPKSISVTLAKGAFRFISGTSAKAAYEIRTPTATMGVRGTVFDVFVADNGESVVLLHEGSVDVCAGPSNCRRHDVIGKIMHIGLGGLLSEPANWNRSLIRGIRVTRAFPFVGRRLAIDPVRRLTHSALSTGRVDDVIRKPLDGLRELRRQLPFR